MADYEGDVPLFACLPYISGASLQEWVLAMASLKNDDCSLVITEQVEKLVCKLGCPQLDGQRSIESLEVTNGGVAAEYAGRECSMVCSASCECSAVRHVGINVKLDRVPVILMNDESAIHGGEVTVKPG